MEMFSHILIQLGTQAAAAGGDNATGQMPGRGRGGMAVLGAYVECCTEKALLALSHLRHYAKWGLTPQ